MRFILTRTEEISGCIEEVLEKLAHQQREMDIKLCLYELLSNAIIHGNCSCETKKVYLEVDWYDEGLSFSVRDEGRGYKDCQIALRLDLDEHGRGLYLISQLADEFFYDELSNTWLVKIKW